MLEKLLIATLALGSVAGCHAARTETSRIEAERNKEIDGFYSAKQILEERFGPDFKEKRIMYLYKNGIEAEVNFKKNSNGMKDLYIRVLSDPNNVLVRNTPSNKTPFSCTYQIMFLENKSCKKAIGFYLNGNKVIIVLNGAKVAYVKFDERDFLVIPPIEKIGLKKVREVEVDLEVESLLNNLDLM